ncbi:MAG: hypothetical protein QM724_11035 [Flavobacteriales bacterium]
MRQSLLFGAGVLSLVLHAQSPVPILMADGMHFVVFQDGVFQDLEARKPQQVFQNGDRLAYISDAGDLKLLRPWPHHRAATRGNGGPPKLTA